MAPLEINGSGARGRQGSSDRFDFVLFDQNLAR